MLNYFDKLRLEGRKLDEGIKKLSKIWNSPGICIGLISTRYAVNRVNPENLEEETKTNAAAEALSKSVAELKESLIEDLEKSEKSLSEMQQFMEDSRAIYEDIKQQCNDIEILFTESGYVPEADEATNPEEEQVDSISSSKDSEKQEVVSTPYLPWKSKLKTFDTSTPEINGYSMKKKPKEKPIQDLEASFAEKLLISNTNFTPYRQSPREPIFSRHYYESVKKKEQSKLN